MEKLGYLALAVGLIGGVFFGRLELAPFFFIGVVLIRGSRELSPDHAREWPNRKPVLVALAWLVSLGAVCYFAFAVWWP
jgi:hypothetical protein